MVVAARQVEVHCGAIVSTMNRVEYNENPEVTKLFLWVTAAESVVFITAGVGLLFFPGSWDRSGPGA